MTTNKNETGRNSGKSATQKTTGLHSKQKRVRVQDMSPHAQRVFVLNALRKGRRHTYWLRGKGCSHPAARVMELIAMGYQIVSHRVTAVDSDGYLHSGVAMYELLADRDADLVDMMEAA